MMYRSKGGKAVKTTRDIAEYVANVDFEDSFDKSFNFKRITHIMNVIAYTMILKGEY